jgi:uncharacterized protein involved in tellurium resistance
MPDKDPNAKVFPVDSRFQQLARRPGGMPRAEAIERAQTGVDEIKQTFGNWFDKELDAIIVALPHDDAGYAKPGIWLDVVLTHCRQLRDVGTTMGFELVTFIAGNFCEVIEAIQAGAEPNRELIQLHVEALRMSKQTKYQRTSAADYPELSSGLHKLLSLAKAGKDSQGES